MTPKPRKFQRGCCVMLGWIRGPNNPIRTPAYWTPAFNPSPGRGRSQVQDHLWLWSGFKANLGFKEARAMWMLVSKGQNQTHNKGKQQPLPWPSFILNPLTEQLPADSSTRLHMQSLQCHAVSPETSELSWQGSKAASQAREVDTQDWSCILPWDIAYTEREGVRGGDFYRSTKEIGTELQFFYFFVKEERTKVPCAFASLTFPPFCLHEQLQDIDFCFVLIWR